MANSLLIILLALAALIVALQLVLLRRKGGTESAAAQAELISIDRTLERMDRSTREDLAKNREEASLSARQLREEVGAILKITVDTLDAQMNRLN